MEVVFQSCSKMNNRINHIHERALRLVYNDYSITFENLLEKDGSLSIHHRNIHRLAIEMFKVYKGTSPKIFMDNFITKENMSLRSNSVFYRPNINSVLKGENSLRNFGPIVWNELLPNFIKNVDTIEEFKLLVKQWKPLNCPCRLCKSFLPDIGFVNIV